MRKRRSAALVGGRRFEAPGKKFQEFLRIVAGKNSVHSFQLAGVDRRNRNNVDIGTHLLEPANRCFKLLAE
jgi:hypothetical protein